MDCLATDGRRLADLVELAIPVCRDAAKHVERTGPGRPPEYQEWQLAVLIVVAIAHGRKSKSSQWRFVKQHEQELLGLLNLQRMPCRDTYSRRYRNEHLLFDKAVELQGKLALKEHVCCAQCVAGDKSLISAKGPPPRRGNKPRKGTDLQAAWSYSGHHHWVWGYSYEVVACAPKKGLVFPLLASCDRANKSEYTSFPVKIPRLAPSVRDVLVDSGYDSNELAEALELDARGKRNGRHFVCPINERNSKGKVGKHPKSRRQERSQRHRQQRHEFCCSKKGRRLYQRRKQTVEPFNGHFKKLFQLEDSVWHRGLDNNRTMILAGMFTYQLISRYAFRRGQRTAQLQWILDGL